MFTETPETEVNEEFHLIMKTAVDIIEFLQDKGVNPGQACAAAGVAFATGCFFNGKSLEASIELITQFYNYTKQESGGKNEADK